MEGGSTSEAGSRFSSFSVDGWLLICLGSGSCWLNGANSNMMGGRGAKEWLNLTALHKLKKIESGLNKRGSRKKRVREPSEKSLRKVDLNSWMLALTQI